MSISELKFNSDKLNKEYTIVRQLVSTANKSTYNAKGNETGKIYIIKSVSCKEMDASKTLDKLRKLNDTKDIKNLIIYDKVVQDKEYIYFIRPIYNNIFDSLNPSDIKLYFDKRGCYGLLSSIISAVNELYLINSYHGGIKFSNIFCSDDENVFYLADYFTKIFIPNNSYLTLKTIRFTTPEELKDNEIDIYADIWQIGVIAYVCVMGEYPFDGNNITDIKNQILYCSFKHSFSRLDHELQRFFEKILDVDKRNRYTLNELETIVKHLFNPYAEGLEYFSRKDYDHAIELLQNALTKTSDNQQSFEICYKLYECCIKKNEILRKKKPYQPIPPESPPSNSRPPSPNYPPTPVPNNPTRIDYSREAIKYLKMSKMYGNPEQKAKVKNMIDEYNNEYIFK